MQSVDCSRLEAPTSWTPHYYHTVPREMPTITKGDSDINCKNTIPYCDQFKYVLTTSVRLLLLHECIQQSVARVSRIPVALLIYRTTKELRARLELHVEMTRGYHSSQITFSYCRSVPVLALDLSHLSAKTLDYICMKHIILYVLFVYLHTLLILDTIYEYF